MALGPTDGKWDDGVTAARAVLLEVTRLLGAYREAVVLVGGWVPELLFGQHPGSLDVDLALDHTALGEVGYATIRQLLERAGYIQDPKREFVFWRHLAVEGRVIEVELDLLAGEYDGTARKRRHQKVQDIAARKARGADLAHVAPLEVPFEGTLPSGAKDRAILRVASLPALSPRTPSILCSACAIISPISKHLKPSLSRTWLDLLCSRLSRLWPRSLRRLNTLALCQRLSFSGRQTQRRLRY